MKPFVTFENGHMKLDVNAFLKSPEGIAQLKSIHDASEHFATEPAMRIVLIEKDGRKAIRTWDDIGDLPAGEYFLYTRTDSAPDGSGEVDDAEALREFTEYFVKNYPGPHTVIMDPNWHAPKIFRAAKRALLRKLQQGAE